ncbi:MAG: VOC family protein [Pseudomonadota bacterium]
MKRIHIGLEVSDLESSIAFYTNLFGQAPVVREADYAKWMPDDPKVNLSISTRGGEAAGGVHFGIQVEEAGELSDIAQRMDGAGERLIHEPDAVCCYHTSKKVWALDPDALRWETFLTSGRVTQYGESLPELEQAQEAKRAGQQAEEATDRCC